ncbi:hypothetical protein O181_008668 [Austropuccinia psidii MF-1]|uniref:Retrovirus-related Pol polyprotein from transposon TNT 1-94-like beta-barrel domain-containing protein n=1 Tax=Austropuccinia psidii MF-1 TaxID=1389203 RepID=A0A9Q3GIQ4_9BASI|nr:hypothetical protein [Austropuccinia psidii MF-1]
MDWQQVVYDGNLQNYIHNCRKMTMELEAVNIIIPKDLLSFSLLGKLADDPDLHQFIENLTLNKDLIEKPEEILICLQDYVSLPKICKQTQNQNAMALVSTAEEPYKIIYYFKNGKQNNKFNTHKKEEFWIENPALRPIRNKKKRRFKRPSTHISIAEALMTSHKNNHIERNQLILDCGATHHMFITKITPTHIQIATGDTKSNLKAVGIGTAQILCNKKNIKLENTLLVPELKCNLISILELFRKQIKRTKKEDSFKLSDDKEEILRGRIINILMIIEHEKPKNLLT